MPSRLTRRNTVIMLSPSESSEKKPTADSYASDRRIKHCTMEGKESSRAGSGGSPIDIEEREKNTVVW